jgi:hypothetical protein
MPVAPAIDRFQPSFFRFDIQNARTGYQDVSLPLILVVPWVRSMSGTPLSDSAVSELQFYIEDAPTPAKVAGPENVGVFVPQRTLYVFEPGTQEFIDSRLNTILEGQNFYASDGTPKTYEEAVNGDYFEYRLRSGTIGRVPYYKDADYYDLSNFKISVSGLPEDDYYFVWQCRYKIRSTTSTNDFDCIRDEFAIARFRMLMAHPGDVHRMMIDNMPAIYLGDVDRTNDPVVKLMRAYADGLQDIFDEQKLLLGVNWINKIPVQLIPYLAYLIGWDLPNFPRNKDSIRRAMLRNGVRLQKLKGTRLAISDLFKIFGFSIELINLWYSKDGKRFIGPNEPLPPHYSDQKIMTQEKCQTDALVSDYVAAGFGQFSVPLLFRSNDMIAIEAWHVKKDGPIYSQLKDIINQIMSGPESTEDACKNDAAGFPSSKLLNQIIPDQTVIGHSRILVDQKRGAIDEYGTGITPLSKSGISYGHDFNVINVTFDHYIKFNENDALFIFAVYPRTKIILPDSLIDLRSNRFDVNIASQSEDDIQSDLLDFLINFIFKLKAFHSLLRKLTFTQNVLDIYNVTDFCLGADNKQDPNYAGGKLEKPPYFYPPDESADKCKPGTENGIITENQKLRSRVIDGLRAEHIAWKDLDGTHILTPDQEELVNRLSRVPSGKPIGTECQYTQFGQELLKNVDLDYDQVPDLREKVCDDDATVNKCYIGRVVDRLKNERHLRMIDSVRCKPCLLGFGSGVYYTINKKADVLEKGGFLGKLRTDYDEPQPSLRFTDRAYFNEDDQKNNYLAWQRRSLDIQKSNSFFPGHRFITADKLLNDYESKNWKAKPWDYPWPTYDCNGINYDNPLNARLEIGSDGNQHIYFDDAPYRLSGNGITQDIMTFGDHTSTLFVTHKIYMHDELQPGDPRLAITFDQTTTTTETTINDGLHIFQSESQSGEDCIDGHPSEYGTYEYSFDRGFERGGTDDQDLMELLNLPTHDSTGSLPLLFKSGSGILIDESIYRYQHYQGLRNDCGCLDCGGSDANDRQCMIDKMRTANGTIDAHCDQLSVLPKLKLNETFGSCSNINDGSIPDSFRLKDAQTEGSFFFKDNYDTQYEVEYKFYDNRLDILTTTKIPHVWGESPAGEIINGRVFRRGIVTIDRKIIEFYASSYQIISAGGEQRIELIQTSWKCGDKIPLKAETIFGDFFNCGIKEVVEMLISCGTRWANVNVHEDHLVYWPDLIQVGAELYYMVPSSHHQPFYWINVWGNDDGIAVCDATWPGTGTEVTVGHDDI